MLGDPPLTISGKSGSVSKLHVLDKLTLNLPDKAFIVNNIFAAMFSGSNPAQVIPDDNFVYESLRRI
jgi:hypothetical protein